MSIPFAQKMTIPFSASLSAYADTKSVADGCYYTDYDGVDDNRSSTDASLKSANKWTLCTEMYLDSGSATNSRMMGNLGGGTGGYIFAYKNTGDIRFYVHDGTTAGDFTWVGGVAAINNQFVKMVATITNAKRELFVDINDTNGLVSRGTNTTALTIENGGYGDFQFGSTGSTEFTKSRIRNTQIYTGEATNPTAWVTSDTTTLSGVALVLQSDDGGSNIETGQVFTTGGAPVRTECP